MTTPHQSWSTAELTGWLVRHTKGLLPPLLISIAARIVNRALGVALVVVPVIAVTRAVGSELNPRPWIVTLVLMALAKALLRYLEHYTGHWVAFYALHRLRTLLFNRLVPQAPAATTGRSGAELTDRATRDIDRIEVFFAHTFPPAISAVTVPSVALGWLAVTVDGWLATVIAPWIGAVVLLVPAISARATLRAAADAAAARGELTAHLGDDLQGVRTLHAFGAVDRRLAEVEEADRLLAAKGSAVGSAAGWRAFITSLLQAGSVLAPLFLGMAMRLDAGAIAIAVAVAVGSWGGMRGIDDFISNLAEAFAATARIRTVIDAQPLVTDHPQPMDMPSGNTVSMTGVTFSYPGQPQPVLSGIDVVVEPESWTYVVGVSGSGKSTLVSLLLRMWDPDAGSVQLDGSDLRHLRLDEVRARIGHVSQRPTLFTGTLADNLRLANPHASDEVVAAALFATDLAAWVQSLPDGLATRVGERGLTVSGGQLQRLALARALVGEPEVLVLDEALSQLDVTTADTVRQRLRAVRTTRETGLTILEVTHRADAIPDEAPAIVLDAGRVVEHGRAGELRAQDGAFTLVALRA